MSGAIVYETFCGEATAAVLALLDSDLNLRIGVYDKARPSRHLSTASWSSRSGFDGFLIVMKMEDGPLLEVLGWVSL